MFDSKIVKLVAKAAGINLEELNTTVLGTTMDGTDTVVTIKTKGMYDITVSVTIDDQGSVTAVTVLDHQETDGLGKAVIEGDFIQSIIDGQDDLDSIDAVAGSTLTSDALVNAVKKALEVYDN